MGGTVSVYAMPYAAAGFGGRSLPRRRRPDGGAVTQPVPPVVNAAADVPGGPGRPAADRSSDIGTFCGTASGESVRAQSARADATAAAVPAEAAPIAGAAWTPPTWEEVVQEHSARVYRLAYRLTGNRHDAEDLTQEVFVRVFRSLSSYTPGTFEGWLHRITTNLFLDQVRRKQRIRFDSLPDDASDRLPGQADLGPERAWEHNNLDHDVQAALDTLPPDFRAAVVLCDIEGLSYEEIAATLDIKLGTVRSRIHRGRAQLREALSHRRPTSASTSALRTPASAGSGSISSTEA
jgi:RNA polymerase sigma-70 factor (ECF subfamily)